MVAVETVECGRFPNLKREVRTCGTCDTYESSAGDENFRFLLQHVILNQIPIPSSEGEDGIRRPGSVIGVGRESASENFLQRNPLVLYPWTGIS